MKRSELERRLRKAGWQFLRHGGKHDVWTNGDEEIAIPRHKEVGICNDDFWPDGPATTVPTTAASGNFPGQQLAKKLLRQAKAK